MNTMLGLQVSGKVSNSGVRLPTHATGEGHTEFDVVIHLRKNCEGLASTQCFHVLCILSKGSNLVSKRITATTGMSVDMTLKLPSFAELTLAMIACRLTKHRVSYTVVLAMFSTKVGMKLIKLHE